MLRKGVLMLAVAAGAIGAVPAAEAAAPPAFLPIATKHVALPAGMQASTPIWTRDGKHLLFSAGGDLHIVGQDGKGLRCLSCGLPNAPHFVSAVQEGFKDIFPDGKRVMWGDFEHNYVLECAPSVVACDQRKLLPIDVSAGGPPEGGLSLGPGVWHLSPDGEHLGWTATKLDTRLMLVGELVREPDRYVAKNVKVLNPPGPKGPTDTDPRGWTNGGALYELKTFSKGGAAITYVTSQFEGNPDMYEVDLATGARHRLTGHPDWDEDPGESPDQSLLTMYSDRGMHRVDAAGLVPRRAFIDYPLSINAAIYYVGTDIGFQCDLQPWLLPAAGDNAGNLAGQPLAPYDGGDVHAQNNIPGRGAWSPDSTKLALTEMSYKTDRGINRLRFVKLDRKPRKAKPIVSSRVGSWAKTPATYKGTTDMPTLVKVQGLHSGSATIVQLGNVLAGHFAVTYDHYSDDGKSFVDGSESVDPLGLTILAARTSANIRISGEHNGYYRSNITIGRQFSKPFASGRASSELDGYKIEGDVPKLGPCPDVLPRAQPLKVATKVRKGRTRNVVSVVVTADSAPHVRAGNHFGDKRPVVNAVVRIAGKRAKTDGRGRARITLRRSIGGRRTLAVTAGSTFRPSTRKVRLPRAR